VLECVDVTSPRRLQLQQNTYELRSTQRTLLLTTPYLLVNDIVLFLFHRVWN